VGLDGVASSLYVVGLIDAGPVLLVDDTGNEDHRRLVSWLQIQRPLGVCFRFFEVPVFVGPGTRIELVLGSYFVNEGAAGPTGGQKSQDRNRADPGPRECHYG